MFIHIVTSWLFFPILVWLSAHLERDVDFPVELRHLLNFDSQGYLILESRFDPVAEQMNMVWEPQAAREPAVPPKPEIYQPMEGTFANSSATIYVLQKGLPSTGYLSSPAKSLKPQKDSIRSKIRKIMNSYSFSSYAELDFLRRVVYRINVKYGLKIQGSSNDTFYKNFNSMISCLRTMISFLKETYERVYDDELCAFLRDFTGKEFQVLHENGDEALLHMKALASSRKQF